MIRAATTLAGPCTGAPRRDFLLGLRHGQLVGAHVPSWCSRHGVDAGCSQRVGPPGQLTSRNYQTPAEGTGWTPPDGICVPRWCGTCMGLFLSTSSSPVLSLHLVRSDRHDRAHLVGSATTN